MEKVVITNIQGRTVFDSNGALAFEIELILNHNTKACGYAPRGFTQGGFECIQYYEDDSVSSKFFDPLFKNTEKLRKQLIGLSFSSQQELDELLISIDGTDNKSNLGGNLSLAVSIAGLYALASVNKTDPYKILAENNNKKKIPGFMFNLLDGSKNSPTSGLECLLIPKLDVTPFEIINISNGVFNNLEKLLVKEYHTMPCISKQGGFCSDKILDIEKMFSLACTAIKNSGFRYGQDFFLGIDIAASDLFNDNKYELKWHNNEKYDSTEMVFFYERLLKSYPLIYIEDALSSIDYYNWKLLNESLGKQIMIAGDDLFATNIVRLDQYKHVANTVVIKPNQIGTISETINFINRSKKFDLLTVISQRTSEIEHNFISHLAVAFELDYIKAGGLRRMERISRYNEILRLIG